jgi:hypothetical protein
VKIACQSNEGTLSGLGRIRVLSGNGIKKRICTVLKFKLSGAMDGYYTYPDAFTPATCQHDVSGVVYPAQVVVENRSTYFDHEDRIKALEKKLEAMVLEKRRQLFV